ncbi:RNA polymerase sigma factor [Cohnella nanjingensis]|uniref:Sigma-70 family RNA polymerase sigma factor n=1 Tax=Cohnella nanjingensis TaxID=1387779 RepID=A0A7X0RY44_9BACL|nr:sigma-70 family RNA polymerase sigma factor [Cohnella nanjingensis]MBB6674224.1 sigma-70 family RNA polymerase sigma factor [Cohnella nanjingensis]
MIPARNLQADDLVSCLADVGQGSVEAFDLLYVRITPFLIPIACQLLGDRMEAEDVCHDVLLGVILHPERYDPARGSVEAWLAMQTKSRCLDRLRKRKKTVFNRIAPADWPAKADGSALPEDAVVARMDGELLRKALAQLPVTQREVLAASYFGSRTLRELAETWQVPLGTVKSRMRYGLAHLRKVLVRLGWEEESRGERHG